jgi:hypothetical protein
MSTAVPPVGTTVQLAPHVGDDPTKGTVVPMTAEETAESATDLATVAVRWSPTYRRLEYVEDLNIITGGQP